MIPKKFDELRLTGALPSPSAVGMRILELTRREDFAIDELAQTIMIDGALSGRVVRLANSAGDARLEPATTIVEATKRLGANRLRTLALGFTLVSDNRSGRCENFDYDSYWAGALAMAVAANVIATRTESGRSRWVSPRHSEPTPTQPRRLSRSMTRAPSDPSAR